MKNLIKAFGFLIFTLVIGFSLTACIEPPETSSKTLSSIAVTNNPVKMQYNIGEAFSKAGMIVTATYTDGSIEAVTDYTVDGLPTNITGSRILTIKYQEKSTTLVVNVINSALETNDITAAQLVADMKIGWNLGNSLDATNGFEWAEPNPTVTNMETGWNNPVTTKAMITAIKNAGFDIIRIPVSWGKASDSNYNIRADWMARVKEVVDYAVDNDMYIILNTHHDEYTFKFTNSQKAASLAAFRRIWEQIAFAFKDYSEKLIFEGLNEPRTIGAAHEWIGNAEERANLNEHYQVFVDVVRESGGNNDKRILMINTYAASATEAAVNGLTLPTDTIANKLIVSIHAYVPFNFAHDDNGPAAWSSSNSSDTTPIHTAINTVYNRFVSQGIPVIMGEFGTLDKNNTPARVDHAEYYISYAASKGVKCIWWDNGVVDQFGIFNRQNNTFHFPQIVEALMNGANSNYNPGNEGGGPLPTPSMITGNMSVWDYGYQAEGGGRDYQRAVCILTGDNLALFKSAQTLTLVLSAVPTGTIQLAWQDTAVWSWNNNNIFSGGSAQNTAIWNAGTKTLTIPLASALSNYANIASQTEIQIVISYDGADNINVLGILSANLSN